METGIKTAQLAAVVGRKNVSDEPEILQGYAQDESFLPPARPWFVVRPRDAGEIREIVRLAGETRTPLIPVSSGPPHFRGDTVPAYGGIVVDLSHMRAIKSVDRQDRVAMIEPGVRFAELLPALEKEGLKLPIPLRPRNTKSVLACFLEREPHTIPKYHLDHTAPLLCAEVVFGTGDVFRTGEAAGPGTVEEMQEAGWRQKLRWEPQTEIMRLVQGAQGTMGIVTWATVRCEVSPTLQVPYLAQADRLEELLEFAYRLVRFRIGDEILILNAKDVAVMAADRDEDIDGLAAKLPRWMLLFCLSGYRYFPAERAEVQEAEARDHARAAGVSIGDAVPGVSARTARELITTPCGDTYWKVREKGGCQDISFIASFHDVPRHVAVMMECVSGKGLSPADVGVYVQPVFQGHGYHCEFSIFFDREDPRESERVRELYLQLGTALMNGGAFFSRPYDLLAEGVYNRDAATRDTLRKIKGVFDPDNIMNPGRLCF